jgi:hypothetical protein
LELWFRQNIGLLNAERNSMGREISNQLRNQMQDLAVETNLTAVQIGRWIHYRQKCRKEKSILAERREMLEVFFYEISQMPTEAEICKLAQTTGLTKFKIVSWFRVKRHREKKKMKRLLLLDD